MKLFAVLSVIIALTESAKLPPNFKKCNRKEADFKKCLVEAANFDVTQLKRAYKRIRLPNLEPFEIPEVSAKFHSLIFNVSEVTRDCKFEGFTDFKFKNFNFDFDAKTFDIGGVWPKLKAHCDSTKINGTIMYIPINGEGILEATVPNYNMNLHVEYSEIHKNNKTYISEVSSRFDVKKPDLIIFRMKGFFVDKEIDAYINKLINDNWSALYDTLKVVYLDVLGQFFVHVINGFFSKVSLEEAFGN